METLLKEQILHAFKEGKTIQSKNGNEWKDFIPQNQVDKPNLDYGGIDNWRIKPETTKSDTQTLIEKLESEKKELLEALKYANRMLKNSKDAMYDEDYIETLIQKHKQ